MYIDPVYVFILSAKAVRITVFITKIWHKNIYIHQFNLHIKH